jgi:hypothetical protein
MESNLQSLFGLLCTYNFTPPHLPPPTAFGLIHEGAIGQPRKTKSLCYSLFLTEDLRMEVLCVRVELSEAERAAGALLHSPPFSAPSSYTNKYDFHILKTLVL